MKVLVCGSRSWDEPTVIGHRLAQLPPDSEILHGAARGADRYAGVYARALGLRETAFPADWDTHGKRAGIIRNLAMLDQRPDLVIAFWDEGSRGTRHTIEEARRRGITVDVVRASDRGLVGAQPDTDSVSAQTPRAPDGEAEA